MIYLDHAATAHPRLQSVREALVQTCDSGNPGRSGHGLGLEASRFIFETRLKLAELLETSGEDKLIFTSGATHALNKILRGILTSGDLVFSTNLEHNAVARVLNQLKEKQQVKWEVLDAVDGNFSDSLCKRIKEGVVPQLVVMNHVSNVTGVRQDLSEVRSVCEAQGISLVIDAAQSFGHEEIKLKQNEAICFSAHKGLMGPMGLGVLAMGDKINVSPVEFGGTGSHSESLEMPDSFPDLMEVGTPNVPAIAAFGAALDSLGGLNQSQIELQELRSYLHSSLSKIPALNLFSPEQGGSAISFDLSGKDLGNFAHLLWSKYQICCRVGLHCAPLAHQSLGTYPNGTLRISLGKSSKQSDCDKFLEALTSEL